MAKVRPLAMLTVVGLMFLASSISAMEFRSLSHLKTKTSPDAQAFTVQEMISRVVPTHAHLFMVKIDSSIGPENKDTFKLENGEAVGSLSITGTSGVAAAWGFYYYLSQYCNSHISWAGHQVALPETLPKLSQPVMVTSNDRFRYYQNVCTVSYSFVWWTWERWEREIDWMAMNGINLPLAFNAQEAIWQRVYLKMGFTQVELDAHFGGAAFLAWSRMGNMQGWGGPLPQSWHIQQVALQHRILQRMRDFGIIPVLPAFAGHVPDAISRLFPNASTTRNTDWGRFETEYCCTKLLNVKDPLFTQIGKAFITEYIEEFGTDHIYNTDTFNEMTPSSSDPAYLKSAGEAVYQAMTAADSQAIWLMQGWLFQDSGFWKPPQAQALLNSVPQGHMIVLDLFSENSPQYQRLSSFFGQPFIWCMLHNFGGTVAMYGKLDSVNVGPIQARTMANSTMIGTGLTPEGINQNNVMYEFMNENSWRNQPRNITTWISNYAVRRYGKANNFVDMGWQLLKATVYNCTDIKKHHNKNLILRRPSRKPRTDFGVYNCTTGYGDGCGSVIVSSRPNLDPPLSPAVWYQPEDLYKSWDNFLMGAHNMADSSLFLYDLVDVTRQSLQVIAIKHYTDIITYYKAKDQDNMMKAASMLFDLLTDLDELLGSDRHFLMGRWIRDARYWGTTQNESRLFEYNARNQVTLWGPNGNILDYACKQWAGLMKHYYLPRWVLFVNELSKSLTSGKSFNQSQFNQDVFSSVEQPFTLDNTSIPAEPTGDPIEIAQSIHMKYRPTTYEHAEFFKRLPVFSDHGKRFIKYSTKWNAHNEGIMKNTRGSKYAGDNEVFKFHQMH